MPFALVKERAYSSTHIIRQNIQFMCKHNGKRSLSQHLLVQIRCQKQPTTYYCTYRSHFVQTVPY